MLWGNRVRGSMISEHSPSNTQAYQSQQSIHQQLTLLIKGNSHAPSHLAETDRYNWRRLHSPSHYISEGWDVQFLHFPVTVQAANSQRAQVCNFINVRPLGNINYDYYTFQLFSGPSFCTDMDSKVLLMLHKPSCEMRAWTKTSRLRKGNPIWTGTT